MTNRIYKLTYGLPENFHKDTAVVSLAEAVGYANTLAELQKEIDNEKIKELEQAIFEVLEGYTLHCEVRRILQDASYYDDQC